MSSEGSLVTWHWGFDIVDYIQRARGGLAEIVFPKDSSMGIEAEYIDVVIQKRLPIFTNQTCHALIKPTIKKLYLHIGAPKTGTTSVQTFLYHQEDLLRKNGITYFKNMCGERKHHFDLFSKFQDNLDIIQSSLIEFNYDIGIMSTELLVFLTDNQKFKDQLGDLLRFCLSREIEIEAVGVVREPLSYILSAYGEDVVGGRCPFTFQDWLTTDQGLGHSHVFNSFVHWQNILSNFNCYTNWFPFEQEDGSQNIADIVIEKIVNKKIPIQEIKKLRDNIILRKSFNGSIIEAVRRLNAENITHWNSYVECDNYDFIEKNTPDFELLKNSPQFISGQLHSLKLDDFNMHINKMYASYNNIKWADGFSAMKNIDFENYLSKTLSKLSYNENLVNQLCLKWQGEI